jgi:hypothetical protein
MPTPKRRIGERTIACLKRCRHLSKDWKCLNLNALALLPLGLKLVDARKALLSFKMNPDGLYVSRESWPRRFSWVG